MFNGSFLLIFVFDLQLLCVNKYSYDTPIYSIMSEISPKRFKAVLVGATGATGKFLFGSLVKAKEYSEITVLGRRKATLPDEFSDIDLSAEESSGRVKQYVIDFDDLSVDKVGEHFEGKDVFFSCMGTTRRQAGSANNFIHIDYGYNFGLAKIAREKNIYLYSLMSTQGANKDSFFLYLNSKGNLEHDCQNLKFPVYSVFRPGFLDRGKDARMVEKLAGLFVNRISVMDVAKAMCSNALHILSAPKVESSSEKIYFNDQILHLSDTYNLN